MSTYKPNQNGTPSDVAPSPDGTTADSDAFTVDSHQRRTFDPRTKQAIPPPNQTSADQVRRVPRQDLALGTIPHNPTDPAFRHAYSAYDVAKQQKGLNEHLLLFNLLAAVEWPLSKSDYGLLSDAFQRMSDLLFDISDGWIALGEVRIGGPELMAAADVQILASNRLLPRAWVGGMHQHVGVEDKKYMPVRIGRGLWDDTLRYPIPWDEMEGTRTLVHEWCHYALMLTDEYLRPVRFGAGEVQVVIPQVDVAGNSIMASLTGTSELVSDQWDIFHEIYSEIPRREQRGLTKRGPGRMPLDRPTIPCQSELGAEPLMLAAPALRTLGLPEDIRPEHVWLYVGKDPDAHGIPRQVIAQGSLEGRSDRVPFALLGAVAGDTLVVVAQRRDQPAMVGNYRIAAVEQERGATIPSISLQQTHILEAALPSIAVIPADTVLPNAPAAQVSVRLTDRNGRGKVPRQVWLYPLGHSGANQIVLRQIKKHVWQSEPQTVETLDGHVLVPLEGGGLLVTSFSQGGDGPESNRPQPSNPINAGSSDGNALLYFWNDPAAPQNYDEATRIKVIVTQAAGLPPLPKGWHEAGGGFCIATNFPLPKSLSPTLVLYHDQVYGADTLPAWMDKPERSRFKICRWHSKKQRWVPLETYEPPGYRFLAASLDSAVNKNSLTAEGAGGERVEFFKVCRVPRKA